MQDLSREKCKFFFNFAANIVTLPAKITKNLSIPRAIYSQATMLCNFARVRQGDYNVDTALLRRKRLATTAKRCLTKVAVLPPLPTD